MPGGNARRKCSEEMPGGKARRKCPEEMPEGNARRKCPRKCPEEMPVGKMTQVKTDSGKNLTQAKNDLG